MNDYAHADTVTNNPYALARFEVLGWSHSGAQWVQQDGDGPLAGHEMARGEQRHFGDVEPLSLAMNQSE